MQVLNDQCKQRKLSKKQCSVAESLKRLLMCQLGRSVHVSQCSLRKLKGRWGSRLQCTKPFWHALAIYAMKTCALRSLFLVLQCTPCFAHRLASFRVWGVPVAIASRGGAQLLHPDLTLLEEEAKLLWNISIVTESSYREMHLSILVTFRKIAKRLN